MSFIFSIFSFKESAVEMVFAFFLPHLAVAGIAAAHCIHHGSYHLVLACSHIPKGCDLVTVCKVIRIGYCNREPMAPVTYKGKNSSKRCSSRQIRASCKGIGSWRTEAENAYYHASYTAVVQEDRVLLKQQRHHYSSQGSNN